MENKAFCSIIAKKNECSQIFTFLGFKMKFETRSLDHRKKRRLWKENTFDQNSKISTTNKWFH